MQWQVYLIENECLKSYDSSHNTRIEAAWQAGASVLALGDDNSGWDSWNINFVRMLQRNIWTGTTRPIQRVLITHT